MFITSTLYHIIVCLTFMNKEEITPEDVIKRIKPTENKNQFCQNLI